MDDGERGGRERDSWAKSYEPCAFFLAFGIIGAGRRMGGAEKHSGRSSTCVMAIKRRTHGDALLPREPVILFSSHSGSTAAQRRRTKAGVSGETDPHSVARGRRFGLGVDGARKKGGWAPTCNGTVTPSSSSPYVTAFL